MLLLSAEMPSVLKKPRLAAIREQACLAFQLSLPAIRESLRVRDKPLTLRNIHHDLHLESLIRLATDERISSAARGGLSRFLNSMSPESCATEFSVLMAQFEPSFRGFGLWKPVSLRPGSRPIGDATLAQVDLKAIYTALVKLSQPSLMGKSGAAPRHVMKMLVSAADERAATRQVPLTYRSFYRFLSLNNLVAVVADPSSSDLAKRHVGNYLRTLEWRKGAFPAGHPSGDAERDHANFLRRFDLSFSRLGVIDPSPIEWLEPRIMESSTAT